MNFNKNKIAIVGLGYVGLPLAVEFSSKFKVYGFDINKKRITELENGYDNTKEIDAVSIKNNKNLKLSSDTSIIRDANIYVITVPTPVDKNNKPDLRPLKSASKLIGSLLKKDNIVIYESTVFPGCTEEICVPILEKTSGLKYNKEFFCGYSPERINPGDKKHTISNIRKITSGSNNEISIFIDELYNSIIRAGTFKASSIAVAEAAKVIENTQRDVNIALINELAIIFNKLKIDTKEVLDAASTKWNFLPFQPGLVGGHCIGVDPYYLTHKAIEVGYHPDIILAGRKINDNVGYFIVENMISEMSRQGINPIEAKVSVLGLTFKENCPDLRNTKVSSITSKLKELNCNLTINDPWADEDEIAKIFKIKPKKIVEINNQDVVMVAVSHVEYSKFKKQDWRRMLAPNGIVIDVKSIYSKDYFDDMNIAYWRL
tara:strand:+ start:60 stop:1352 length:1293 start_codon:yes stop_codon:yes gene_type:complete